MLSKAYVGAIAMFAAGQLISCASADSNAAASTETSSTTSAIASTTLVPPSSLTSAESTSQPPLGDGACPNRAKESSPAEFDDSEGTYAAYITGFDSQKAQASFDVIQWLSGSEAVKEYRETHPDDPEGPSNDYWTRNDNLLVRSAPVARDAVIMLVRLATDQSAGVSEGTLAELPTYLKSEGVFPETVWWLTFKAGTVTEICEQYTP